MRREYKDKSPRYGIAGYIMAIGTGYLRMYNTKHWFNDVVAGAGFGILSTTLGYKIYPPLKKMLLRRKGKNAIAVPFYKNSVAGILFASIL